MAALPLDFLAPVRRLHQAESDLMPVCVTGMHRSGTSLVAQALDACGLDFGPQDELLPGDEFNRKGYWENRRFVELDDRLLEAAEGAWDVPPPAASDWNRLPAARVLRMDAEALLAELDLTEPWGWKDPRAALSIRFWLELVPELRVVVGVRHPVEVAFSLERRGSMSLTLALRLWTSYNSTLLDAVPPQQRVVTHFGRYFEDPVAEVRRVVDGVGLDVPDERVEAAARRAERELRSAWYRSMDDLPKDVRDLYLRLCAEAEARSDAAIVPARARGRSAKAGARKCGGEDGTAPAELLAATRLRLGTRAARLEREVTHLRQLVSRAQQDAEALSEELRQLRSESELLRADRDHWREADERLTAQLERAVEGERRLEAEAVQLRDGLAEHAWRLEAGVRERDEAVEEARRLRGEVDALGAAAAHAAGERDRLAAKVVDLERTLEDARTALADSAAEVERLSAAYTEVTGDRDTWRSEANAIRIDRDAWQAQAEAISDDREVWRTQGEALGRDRDAWRTEAEALRVDRDAWRGEAENWRRETLRLVSERERGIGPRVRRVAFRFARAVWWRLPHSIRDFVRPIVFPSARVPKLDHARAATETPLPRAPRARASATRRRKPPLTTQISVVIPTLNGGQCFERLLSSIRRQEGISRPEIVVVDSGSTDGTQERAEEAGARLVSIPPNEFGHGRTRNYAASLSDGEILVLMVQDAILLGPTALRELACELLEEPSVAAVSARQVPRADADLYAAFAVCAHYAAIWGAQANGNGTVLDRRAASSIDNVCAAIRRAAWEELQFSDVEFAEDLDFGVRALERGWSVLLSRRAAVAHSHTRDALYHLKRSIADRLYVAPLLGDDRVSKAAEADLDELLVAASAFLAELQGAVSLAVVETAPLDAHLAELRRLLDARPPRMPPAASLSQLESFLGRREPGDADETVVRQLRRELFGLLDWQPLRAFATAQRNVEPAPAAEFAASLTASAVGHVLGDAFRVGGENIDRTRFLAGV